MPRDKARAAAREKKWRQENHERDLENHRKWRAAHKAEQQEYFRKYAESNKEEKTEYLKKWYQDHREEELEKSKSRHKANPENRRNTVRKQLYGIEPDEYKVLYSNQDGKCAICKQPPKSTRSLCVDHDHKTGAVRGLLCDSCNGGIGLLGDSIIRLHEAIEYLTLHSTQPTHKGT